MPTVICLNCGAPMHERGCKVKCGRCGIFFDCGDGMLPMAETDEAPPGPRATCVTEPA